jgi:hypothetical protein
MFSGKKKFGDGSITQNIKYFCSNEHVDRFNKEQPHKVVLVRTPINNLSGAISAKKSRIFAVSIP